jgi:hypothetical protein
MVTEEYLGQESALPRKSQYIEWLSRSRAQALYASKEEWWCLYQGALLPAAIMPHPSAITLEEAQRLLAESGAWFLRYFTRTFTEPTEFWWIACKEYDAVTVQSRARNYIRRAYKTCAVRRLNRGELEEQIYLCYRAAFSRYSYAKPASANTYLDEIKRQADGPFDRWGVFVGEHLAGFANCGVEDSAVGLLSLKLDPKYLNHYPAYALMDTILTRYVGERRLLMTNGFRAISHDTDMDGFLRKFGFVRHYCDLKIVYGSRISTLVRAAYPFRKLLERLSGDSYMHKARALLFQETMRRSFCCSEDK